MILFIILLIILLILAVFMIFGASVFGAGFILLFADVIVCAVLIIAIMRRIIKKKRGP